MSVHLHFCGQSPQVSPEVGFSLPFVFPRWCFLSQSITGPPLWHAPESCRSFQAPGASPVGWRQWPCRTVFPCRPEAHVWVWADGAPGPSRGSHPRLLGGAGAAAGPPGRAGVREGSEELLHHGAHWGAEQAEGAARTDEEEEERERAEPAEQPDRQGKPDASQGKRTAQHEDQGCSASGVPIAGPGTRPAVAPDRPVLSHDWAGTPGRQWGHEKEKSPPISSALPEDAWSNWRRQAVTLEEKWVQLCALIGKTLGSGVTVFKTEWSCALGLWVQSPCYQQFIVLTHLYRRSLGCFRIENYDTLL